MLFAKIFLYLFLDQWKLLDHLVTNRTNFTGGNVEHVKEATPVSQEEIVRWRENAIRKEVAIVGGGVSGMAALKEFLENDFDDVILLEAQDRLGGRIKTFRNGSTHVEDGAEWIHGEERNIVYRIANEAGELREVVSENEYDYRIIREDGSSAKEDWILAEKVRIILEDIIENGTLEGSYSAYGKYFAHRFEKDIAKGRQSDLLDAWLNYMEQTVNAYEGSASWNDVAADDAHKWEDFGADRKWKNGYDTLLKHLSKSFPTSAYLLNTPVKHIFWSLDDATEVLLVTNDGRSFLVDHVIVTVSVEYLKRHQNTLFIPPIPEPLKTSLQGIALGGANKIFIGWPSPWWGDGLLSATILWRKLDLPPSKDWLYGIGNIHSVEERREMLQIFVTGNSSKKIERKEESELQEDLLWFLKRIFNRDDIPSPSFFRRTCWNSNIWTLGSYGSYITVEGSKAGLKSRAPFRIPLTNKQNPVVHWAGEHTHDIRYATVDGALLTGIREARNILDLKKTLESSEEE